MEVNREDLNPLLSFLNSQFMFQKPGKVPAWWATNGSYADLTFLTYLWIHDKYHWTTSVNV